jgi:hypothetical protein
VQIRGYDKHFTLLGIADPPARLQPDSLVQGALRDDDLNDPLLERYQRYRS